MTNKFSFTPPTGTSGSFPPSALTKALAAGLVTELDIRPLLETGVEPFRAIMDAATRLRPGEVLQLIVPFEPVPLHDVMAGRGFGKWIRAPEPGSSHSWEIYSFPPLEPDEETADPPKKKDDSGVEDMIELDVRDLPPRTVGACIGIGRRTGLWLGGLVLAPSQTASPLGYFARARLCLALP